MRPISDKKDPVRNMSMSRSVIYLSVELKLGAKVRARSIKLCIPMVCTATRKRHR